MSTYPSRNGIREHRLVWEEANGPIPTDHVIHHRNGDITDNRLENLELLTATEHQRHHHLGRKRNAATRIKMSATARSQIKQRQVEGRAGGAQPGRKQSPEHLRRRLASRRAHPDGGNPFQKFTSEQRSAYGRLGAQARWGRRE